MNSILGSVVPLAMFEKGAVLCRMVSPHSRRFWWNTASLKSARFFKSVLDTQNVVYIKNVQTKLLEVKKVIVGWFLVGQGTKRAENANIWPKMTKNAHFGPNLAVFGPKSLIFMGLSKSFGTNITENHFGNLSALFFGHALDQVGQKCRYLAQNASFGPNLAVFGPQIQFFGGRE